MKVRIFIIIWALISACSSPKELTVFTKKSVDLNEPIQVGFMLNFKPTKFKLKQNDSFKIIEEPRIVNYNEELNTYLIRYLIQPIESGNHDIPRCMVYDKKESFITQEYSLNVSNKIIDSALSKLILSEMIQPNIKETNKEETKTIYLSNKVEKNQYEFSDTIKISYSSAEFEFDYHKLINLRNFKIVRGPIFNSKTEFSNGVMTKIGSVSFNLLSTNRGEQTIPAIDTIIKGNKILADEIKIKVK